MLAECTYLKGDTKSVLIIRGAYYQGWFMYMRYTQGQSEEYFLSRGVCTKPGTYYPGWFMYMSYTQGLNEGYSLSRSMY